MEVSKVNYTPVVKPSSSASRPVTSEKAAASDTVSLSKDALSVAQHVESVRNMEEVRPEKVEQFKSDVHRGLYPPPAIIEGLSRLMGAMVK
jgi:anti-sigma28 factor (negative regulator of flagellin synthesis)